MLYRGRYLIVLLDKFGEIENVVDGSYEYAKFKKISQSNACKILNRVLRGESPKSKIILVDCFEKHDDVFAEEDAEFLKYLQREGKYKTNKQRAEDLGISERTLFRWGLNKNKIFKEKTK